MFRHLFKLVWNRKKTNILIMLEVFFSFIVVFALSVASLQLLGLYLKPLGYEYLDVWSIDVEGDSARYGSWNAADAGMFRRLLGEIEAMPEVVHAAAGTNAPFSNSASVMGWKYEGREVESEIAQVSPTFPDVLRMPLVEGRWFGEQDTALAWEPVVIDLELARLVFGDEDPLGKRIGDIEDENDKDRRVVGVIADFRRQGEFADPTEFMFMPARLDTDDGPPLNRFVIQVASGTGADFEEALTDRLQGIARNWTFTVQPLEAVRASQLRQTLLGLVVASTVAGFLLLMVVLGLTGVMWQNVTRRTKEMGLRRATGAPRASIHRQIVGEVMVTAGFGVIVGVLLCVQLPMLGPIAFVQWNVVLAGLAVSSAFMLALAAACGLYPGWSATRINPAEALHYE